MTNSIHKPNELPNLRRIYHPWHKWECFRAGFYNSIAPNGWSPGRAKGFYRDFLGNDRLFASSMGRVEREWICSSEHFLTNSNINRVAWLGQAAACISMSLPNCFRGGFSLLTESQQRQANELAFEFLRGWLYRHDTKEN